MATSATQAAIPAPGGTKLTGTGRAVSGARSGTDHGTGGAGFLLGGAVSGGAVRAEWTGLTQAALQDGRDQPARTDLRSLFKGVLAEHMGVPASVLSATVFPDSTAAPTMSGLIRA